jgi:hypothetical protein
MTGEWPGEPKGSRLAMPWLDADPLHVIDAHLVAAAIVETNYC